MSDTVDDAAWPPRLNNPSLVGTSPGPIARRKIRQRGRRSADPHPSESGNPCLRSVWQGSH